MENQKFGIDLTAAYKLMDVLDKEGHSKVETRSLYQERIYGIATNFHPDCFDGEGRYRIFMDFIQTADGRWSNMHLHTSRVEKMEEEDDILRIVTRNSIYVFQRVDLPDMEYLEDQDLIELFLTNEDYKFCRGIYYDLEGKAHDLYGYPHIGMFSDTMLIGAPDVAVGGRFVCRYYVDSDQIQFYDTLYGQQDYSTRMLIHNEDTEPMVIRFEGYPATWTIQPGTSKFIIPFRRDGADEG